MSPSSRDLVSPPKTIKPRTNKTIPKTISRHNLTIQTGANPQKVPKQCRATSTRANRTIRKNASPPKQSTRESEQEYESKLRRWFAGWVGVACKYVRIYIFAPSTWVGAVSWEGVGLVVWARWVIGGWEGWGRVGAGVQDERGDAVVLTNNYQVIVPSLNKTITTKSSMPQKKKS